MRYLLVGSTKCPGIYLVPGYKGDLDLCKPADLKSLELKDALQAHKTEVCRLLNRDKVFAVEINKVPEGAVLFTLEKRITQNAYYAISAFRVKLIVVGLIVEAENPQAKQLLLNLLGMIEPQFTRGYDYGSWIQERSGQIEMEPDPVGGDGAGSESSDGSNTEREVPSGQLEESTGSEGEVSGRSDSALDSNTEG